MPGPAPKAANQRRRRNVASTATELTPLDPGEIVIPDLPVYADDMKWHPLTVSFWNDLWSSPMSVEYDRSDIHGMLMFMDLVNTYWQVPASKPGLKALLAAEIRLQRQGFGLTPIDRRRLQWTIEKVDEAQDAGARRRGQSALSGGADDPRRAREVLDAEVLDEPA